MSQLGRYYQTTDMTAEGLAASVDQALGQDERLLEFFQRQPRLLITAEQVWDLVFKGSPRSSATRSMNTLMKAGLIVKTDQHVMGPYGKPVHLWRLARKDGEQLDLI